MTEQNSPRVEFQVRFRRGDRGRRQVIEESDQTRAEPPSGELPRLTKLLALAHRWNRLIEEGAVSDRAEIARTMGLSRARVTQIMDLLYLASEIQERILGGQGEGVPEVPEREVRSLTKIPIWKMLCRTWNDMLADASHSRK
jgi:hypothetical protein